MDTIYEQACPAQTWINELRYLILEVYYWKGKEFVAIVAVRGELGEKKREFVSRNVRKEDATFATEKLVEIYTNMEIDIWKSFGCRLCRAKTE